MAIDWNRFMLFIIASLLALLCIIWLVVRGFANAFRFFADWLSDGEKLEDKESGVAAPATATATAPATATTPAPVERFWNRAEMNSFE